MQKREKTLTYVTKNKEKTNSHNSGVCTKATHSLLFYISDSCRHLEFRAAGTFHGKRLVNHMIRTVEIAQKDFCGALCFMEHKCVSYNIEVTSELSTKCELNNSTHIEYPDNLKPWSNSNYRGANVR